MCGICGLACIDTGKRADASVIGRMNDAMVHRGPDDAGVWLGGHVALGMRRLSVLDILGGRQPMQNEDGSIVLVFNGEIYNFRELRTELESHGHVFRTQSDTEVIVHAYEQYGDAALLRLNGMFAFALYDHGRNRLLLARDRLGIKPLFFAFKNGALAFASELDALLRSGLIDGVLSPQALDAYFTFLYIPAPDTIFRDSQKLRPGEKLVLEKGRLTRERYWRVAFEPDRAWTLDSAAAAYRELLTDAVRLRRVSDVPLGAFLSGGVDSSSVVGVLSQLSAGPVKTFTIGFDDAHADELRFARIAAKAFGTDHTETLLEPDMTELAPTLVRHFGEPFADSSALPMWLVSKVARKSVTVALSGDGGDELLAGYTWAHMSHRVRRYQRAWPGSVRRAINAAVRATPRSPWTAKIRRFSADSFLAPHDVFRRRQTCFNAELRAQLMRPDIAKAVAAESIGRFEEHARAAGNVSDDDKMLYQDLVMYLPDDILTKVDRMSMANSLEARVPLLDHRIVEFAATVPFPLKFAGRTSKRLAKRAVKDLVPAALLAQRKRGFAIPIQRWFRKELRGHFKDVALAEDAYSGKFLERDAIRSLFDIHLARKEDYGHHLWALLMFEHWLRYAEAAGLSVSL
ncbi:MAG TPA: asparagine synthase (glutamine-hydrolyzing) [Candidatus Hydrogenedentes bacterium]|nr:asparagine synthase (glutamine-hydrolyzing) [Candidatus Hydrogenedentota bacterium]HIJ74031.1 asparagine synthase (glutamine-hydrolyzing) [Candidatus Hydrogenedentota bacterium]